MQPDFMGRAAGHDRYYLHATFLFQPVITDYLGGQRNRLTRDTEETPGNFAFFE